MTSHLLDNVGTLAAFALQPPTLGRQHLIVEAYSLLASSSLCAEARSRTSLMWSNHPRHSVECLHGLVAIRL
jgi:hypothetical protein